MSWTHSFRLVGRWRCGSGYWPCHTNTSKKPDALLSRGSQSEPLRYQWQGTAGRYRLAQTATVLQGIDTRGKTDRRRCSIWRSGKRNTNRCIWSLWWPHPWADFWKCRRGIPQWFARIASLSKWMGTGGELRQGFFWNFLTELRADAVHQNGCYTGQTSHANRLANTMLLSPPRAGWHRWLWLPNHPSSDNRPPVLVRRNILLKIHQITSPALLE